MSNFTVASLLVLAILMWHARALEGLARVWWESATYSHGFLLVPAVIYAWWRRRTLVDRTHARPQPLGLVALGAICFGIAVCELAALETGTYTLLPAALLAALYAAFGWPVARLAVLPLMLVYCAVPLWSVLTPYLQILSAVVSAAFAAALGVVLIRDGTTIEIASGSFEVVLACAGTNFLLVALSVALLLGEMLALRWRTLVVVLATSAVVAMFGNWLRIVGLIVLGDLSGMQHYLVAEDHYVFGWVAFAVPFCGWIWLVGRWLGRRGPPARAAVETLERESATYRPLLIAALAAVAVVGMVSWVSSSAAVRSVLQSAVGAHIPGRVQNEQRLLTSWHEISDATT